MAFIGIFLMYFFILIAILVGLFVIGWIIMLIGLANQKKVKLLGKKYPHVLISIGAVMVLIPMLCVGSVVVSSVVSKVKLAIERRGYDNFVDKWENEYVPNDEAGLEAIEWVFEAADNGDKDAIIEVFAKDVQDDSEFIRQIDAFLAEYPGNLSGAKIISKGGDEARDYDYNTKIEIVQFYYTFEIIKDGMYYYVDIGGCKENDYDPEQIGIEYFILKSDRVVVCNQDVIVESTYNTSDYDEYILAQIEVGGDFTTRRVGGCSVKFYDFDRNLTKEDVVNAYDESADLKQLVEKIGEPNSKNITEKEVIYEIEPIDGEPRYVKISYDDKEYIRNIRILGDEEGEYY